jgi:hypothetical protein
VSLHTIRVDWQRAALNIRAHCPLIRASRQLGEHDGFLSQWARGEMTTEPKFSTAVKLLDLHTELCGAEATAKLRVQ